MHKDEIWQLYYGNGEPIKGEGWPAAKNNPTGDDTEIVGVAIVFLFRKNKEGELELLWQKRSDAIDRYPGDYDISAGGHVNLDEKIVDAAVREAREEIGAVLETSELGFVTMYPFNKNRFAWIYAVDWTFKEDAFHFDDKEVSEVRWVPLKDTDEFRKKFAKKPLKEDPITFETLKYWFEIHGNL